MKSAHPSLKTLLLLRLSMQCTIALVLSLAMTLINFGVTDTFVQDWLKAFVVAFLIIPVALRLIPFVGKGVHAVLGKHSPFIQRCAIAVCVAVLMEGIIALAITFTQYGLISGWPTAWGLTFLKALPLGLLIGFTMTFLVQPRMQKLSLAAKGM